MNENHLTEIKKPIEALQSLINVVEQSKIYRLDSSQFIYTNKTSRIYQIFASFALINVIIS